MDKPHFLIVDDSNSVRYAMEQTLGPVADRIYTASNTAEGKKVLSDCHVDLVVTDVEMPGQNGLDFCRELKSNPQTADLPVIILSSLESDEDIDMGFKVGADAYVPKSTATGEIIAQIEMVLNRTALTKNRLILVVDDSKTVLAAMGEGLKKAGFKVALAETGEKALSILDRVTPDLILTDLIMPDMNGSELCRQIMARKELASIPLVMMSCVNDTNVMQRMVQQGIAAYITKPIGINNLIQILKQILSEQFHLMLEEKKRLVTEQALSLASITSLVRALEIRDRYTCGHSEAVTGIAVGMARQMGINEEEIRRLHTASLLHDLGKIGIRDDVLLKPGALTKNEFEHIKQHTTMAGEILAPLPGMSDVLLAATSHHERWDGSGYPRGLAGKDIPLFGRIIAVADVFDAITSDRVYRKSRGLAEAKRVISQGRGKLFCPECVDAFFRWHSQFTESSKDSTPYCVWESPMPT